MAMGNFQVSLSFRIFSLFLSQVRLRNRWGWMTWERRRWKANWLVCFCSLHLIQCTWTTTRPLRTNRRIRSMRLEECLVTPEVDCATVKPSTLIWHPLQFKEPKEKPKKNNLNLTTTKQTEDAISILANRKLCPVCSEILSIKLTKQKQNLWHLF